MKITAREFDEARLAVLRRRLGVVWRVLGAAVIIESIIPIWVAVSYQERALRRPQIVSLVVVIAMGIWLMLAPWIRARRFARMTLPMILRRAELVMLASLMAQLVGATILAASFTQLARDWGWLGPGGNLGPAFPIITFLCVTHTALSLVMPWTVRDAVRPIAIFFAFVAVMDVLVFRTDSVSLLAIGLIAIALAGVPGLLITVLRSSKFGDRLRIAFLSRRQEEIDRELGAARRIHERLFPAQGRYGPVRVVYSYEPMRQIGGDYLYCHADSRAVIAVLDVTGHGIGSALAVNRLHGEIKRVMAQQDPGPDALLRSLNDYVSDTLAEETVFATAFALRVQGASVQWCNAGHPPAMLIRSSGQVQTLDTTAMMLGVTPWGPEETICGECVELLAGDVLFVYTDGAVEAMSADGKQFGIDGVRAVLARLAGRPPEEAVRALDVAIRAHRNGAPQDDTLIVAITTAES